MAPPSRNSQASAESAPFCRTTRDARRSTLLCLSKWCRDQQRKPRSIAKLASYASKSLSQSVETCLYSLQTSHVLYGWVLPQHTSCLTTYICLNWHHSANQPKSVEVTRNYSTPQEVLWCISLYGVSTNAAQLHSVRQTNTCVSLAKNPSSHVLSRACFSRTSSLLCLLQWNVPSRVCLSLSPVSTSGIFHLYPLQENTPLLVCPSTQVTNTTGLPKNTQVSIANRTLVE